MIYKSNLNAKYIQSSYLFVPHIDALGLHSWEIGLH